MWKVSLLIRAKIEECPMAANKTYWKNTEQLNEKSPIVDQLEQKEFAEYIPVNEFLEDKEALEDSSTSRRDFLKYVGFSTAAASLAACEGPVIKSVPYVVQPEQIRPGLQITMPPQLQTVLIW